MNQRELLAVAKRVKALADTGLVYTQNEYDRERYEELLSISLQLLSAASDQPLSGWESFFMPATDYPTPKVDVRGLVLNEAQEVLLVREKLDGRWSLPGGWGEIGRSPSEVIEKEIHEETGLEAKATALLAVYDKRCHPHPPQPFYVYKLCFRCEVVGGTVHPGFDIEEVRYFDRRRLPPLSEDRILATQIEQLYHQATQTNPIPYFD